MNKKWLGLTLAFWIFIFTFQPDIGFGLPWPFDPDTVQHHVTSTFGEYRPVTGTSPPYNAIHFHDGIDIYGPMGTFVYAVQAETIWAISYEDHYVQTQYHDYRHISPYAGLYIGKILVPGSFLGWTADFDDDDQTNNDHLHFTSEDDQENGDDDYGWEYNPLYVNYGEEIILQPFSDTHYPKIHWIKFFKNETTTELYVDSIAGYVDIVVRASDTTSYPNGADINNGIYQVSYYIDSVGYWMTNIFFDSWTEFWDMDYVYANTSTMSIYKYISTNGMNYDDYWDTYGVNDGYHDIYIEVCDQSFNCVQETITIRVYNTTDIEENKNISRIPDGFYLSQNYPNPFNHNTTIPFTILDKQKTINSPIHTILTIFNVLGQEVKTLVDEPKTPGFYNAIWDGKDDKGDEVASGVYLYRLEADDFKEVKKMILLK